MSEYNFFPFVEPTNLGSIEFPDFDTILRRGQVSLPSSTPKPEEPVRQTINLDDLAIDFSKVKISRGRQTKNTNGYKQDALKTFGKELKKRGANIDFTSKDSLIDSILLLE